MINLLGSALRTLYLPGLGTVGNSTPSDSERADSTEQSFQIPYMILVSHVERIRRTFGALTGFNLDIFPAKGKFDMGTGGQKFPHKQTRRTPKGKGSPAATGDQSRAGKDSSPKPSSFEVPRGISSLFGSLSMEPSERVYSPVFFGQQTNTHASVLGSPAVGARGKQGDTHRVRNIPYSLS